MHRILHHKRAIDDDAGSCTGWILVRVLIGRAIAKILGIEDCGMFGEIEMRTQSHDGMRPQLLSPSCSMSARMCARVSISGSRASIASTPPACTHCGSKFFSGFEPAA